MGNRVREIRRTRGLTQQALAEKARVSISTVVAVEAGRSRPRVDVAMRIAEALQVPMEELFGEDEGVASKGAAASGGSGPASKAEGAAGGADALGWLSENLREVENSYAGQWIAIVGDRVVAHSATLPELLRQIEESKVESPFITKIPAEPAIWTTAYAG